MANDLIDLSETADSNETFRGVSILGSAKGSTMDNALRTLGVMIARTINGVVGLRDAMFWFDPTDTTKRHRFDSGNVPSGTTREIDAEAAYQLALKKTEILADIAMRRAPLITPYIASATHTFATTTTLYQLVAVAPGGGSGNVDGLGSGGGSTAGANSGFYGESLIYAKGALEDGTIVIGAAGIAGAGASGSGGDGGDVTWTDDTVGTLTWKGGKGSVGLIATAQHAFEMPLANDASSVSLKGFYGLGLPGSTNGVSDAGGLGGSSLWGTGGISTRAISTVVNGVSGTGYGVGASGSASSGTANNAGGAAGTGGRLEVWEW